MPVLGGAGHGLDEGALDVGRGQDAVDLAGVLDDEVLGGGGGAQGVEEVFAGEFRGDPHAVGEVLGEAADGDPGAAVFGYADDGGLADEGEGFAVGVDDDEGAGAGFVGAAQGLGEGVSVSTGTARRVRLRARSSGRCSRRRAMRRLLPAPVQMIAARMAASRASMTVSMPTLSSALEPRAPDWVSRGGR